MKKIMSLVLALALVLSMGVTVFAAESTNPTTVTNDEIENNNTNIDVTAGYTAPSYAVAGTVYHVVVAWQKSGTVKYVGDNFTYTWNPETITVRTRRPELQRTGKFPLTQRSLSP